MFEVYALLIISTFLANMVESNTMQTRNRVGINKALSDNGKIALWSLTALLIWFSGTRTRMNDTATYIRSFRDRVPSTIDSIKEIEWSLGNYPIFQVYSIMVKSLISDNPQVFILITSAIVVSLTVAFLYYYSWNFGQSVYFFMTFTVYAFTMAAIKQTMATSIAIWMIPCMQRKRYLKLIAIFFLSIFIHPYVIVLFISGLLYNKGVWNRTVMVLIGITVVIGVLFQQFTSLVFGLTSLIGQDYAENWEIAQNGVSLFRVLAYAFVPLLSLIYKEQIDEYQEPFFDLCVNMSIIAFCFSIISRLGGGVLFGRIPEYFGIFICIAIPYILSCAEADTPDGRVTYFNDSGNSQSVSTVSIVVYMLFFFYYASYYHKFFIGYNVSMWGSVYNRVPLHKVLFGGL